MPPTQQVFKALAERGRITLRALLQHARLPPKHIHHGLTVLIQQHLILHNTINTITYFEVDWRGAYCLLQNGKILSAIEERFGGKGARVAAALLQLGHARVQDLEGAFHFAKTSKPVVSAESADIVASDDSKDDRILSREDLHQVLTQLIDAGYVCKLHTRTYQPHTDRQNEIEETVKEQAFATQRTTGPKQRVIFLAEVMRHKRSLEMSESDVADYVTRPGKRRKLNGANGHMDHEADSYVKEAAILAGELVLKVNLEKCLVALRSDKLIRHALRYLGETTSKVYEAFLRVYENKIPRCRNPDEEDNREDPDNIDDDYDLRITTEHVLTLLEEESDSMDWLDVHIPSTDDGPPSKKRTVKSKGPRESQHGTPAQRRILYLQELNNHLSLLAEHQLHFTTKLSTAGFGEYSLSMARLIKSLRQQEIENVIGARYGSMAVRIVRLLRRHGKLDEKQVSDKGLMRMRDARLVLDRMHERSFVESQEIPKDSTRQPSRALYLWYYDQARLERHLVDWSYVAMSRCLQRRKMQRHRVKEVLEKAERSDVVGHEDELLTEADKIHLRTWQEQESKLLMQIARMDDTVSLLRDY